MADLKLSSSSTFVGRRPVHELLYEQSSAGTWMHRRRIIAVVLIWLMRPRNRLTIAVVLGWLLYLLGESPWRGYHATPIYLRPARFFLQIGFNVGRAFGLSPDLGWVQFCAGLVALILTFRLAIWTMIRC